MLAGQTPSYPFPKMYPSPSSAAARSAQESSPMLNHSHFKLTLPAEKLKFSKGPSSQPSDERPPPVMKTPTPHSVFLPPQHKPVMEDPIYPSPNLYDITLQLSADPGLDAWWSNVVNILQTYYGAERASLAVPGDATDLENVPWGQKAVFDQNLSEDPDSIHHLYGETSRAGPSGADSQDTGTVVNNSSTNNVNTINNTTDSHSRLGSVSAAKRPSLLSRHSFAGFGKDRKHAAGQDPSQLLHKIKVENAQSAAATNAMDMDSGLSQGTPTENCDKANVMTPQTHSLDDALITTPQHSYRQAVFPIPRPLEVESDPLIKRTGVVKLFGRTKPVVLTREYSKGSANVCSDKHGGTMARSPADDKVQVTPTAEPIRPGVPKPRLDLAARPFRPRESCLDCHRQWRFRTSMNKFLHRPGHNHPRHRRLRGRRLSRIHSSSVIRSTSRHLRRIHLHTTTPTFSPCKRSGSTSPSPSCIFLSFMLAAPNNLLRLLCGSLLL